LLKKLFTFSRKSTKNKDKLCEDLHKLLKDVDYSRLSSSPDRARIIQMMLKKAPNNIKIEIAMKLIPHISEISMSKYGKFCVSRLMVYCGKDMREKAINGMLSKIVKLTSHKFSSALIDMIYLNYASNDQKNFMKQELYSDLYKKDKNKSIKTLSDTWADSDILKKGTINSTKMNLIKFASKNLIDNSLVHAVLLEFIEATEEQERNEVIQAYIPHLAAIASTKQGSRAAVLCYLYSVAKERRAMLKGIKEHLTKLCVHEHGHLLILAILNSTDDTINIRKTLLSHFVSNIEEIVSTEYGKRIIFFIVSPSTEFIHPKILESLTNDLKLGTQKKDVLVRRKELLDSIEKDLCTCIKNNANFWLKGGHIAQVTVSILQNMDKANESRSEVFDSICSVICDTNWTVDEHESNEIAKQEEEPATPGKIKKRKNPLETAVKVDEKKTVSGIEHSGLHIAIKKIAKLPDFAKSFILHLNENTVSKNYTIILI
jgi:pumilio homology domain family member 6